jgi:PhoD related phosphatase
MPNIISSAIVNAPPPDTVADLLNKRNKVHHLDADTDEDMITIFTHDVNGKPRNNKRLLNRRNWCSIRQYDPDLSPPPTPQTDGSPTPPPSRGLFRRLSRSRGPTYRADAAPAPPLSNAGFFGRRGSTSRRGSVDSQRPGVLTRTLSLTRKDFMPATLFRRTSKRRPDDGGINGYGADSDDDISHYQNRSGIRGGSGGRDEDDNYFPTMPVPTGRTAEYPVENASTSVAGTPALKGLDRSQFQRSPSGWSQNRGRNRDEHEINLEGGLDVTLHMEVSPRNPDGITMPYRLLVPALWYSEEEESLDHEKVHLGGLKRFSSVMRRNKLDKGKARAELA